MTARDIDNLAISKHPMTFRNDCGHAHVGGKEAHLLPNQHVNARLSSGAIVYVAASDRIVINPARIAYGLFPGSGDRVGWRTIIITPDMIGARFAQFLSVEIKTLRDRMSDEQVKWANAVVRDGGRAEIWKETSKGLEVTIWPNV